MSDDQFTKLFKYMQGEFAALRSEMDQRFEKSDTRFDQVMSALDSVLKNQETEEQERLAMNHQLERHEHWIAKAAKQLGVSYER